MGKYEIGVHAVGHFLIVAGVVYLFLIGLWAFYLFLKDCVWLRVFWKRHDLTPVVTSALLSAWIVWALP